MMLFVTNRGFNGHSYTSSQAVTFDLDDNTPHSLSFCLREQEHRYVCLDFDTWVSQLGWMSHAQLLLYVHGYNNLPEDNIFQTTHYLQAHLNTLEPEFCQVIPFIWPCDNDFGVIKDYWDDQNTVDKSAPLIVQACHQLSMPALLQRLPIHVLAHSMGNRLLRGVLSLWREQHDLPRVFKHLFCLAADVVHDTLNINQRGAVLAEVAEHVWVYHATDDWMLRLSHLMNIPSRKMRLGLKGPPSIEKLPPNVHMVDCDKYNNLYDRYKGHTYFYNQAQQEPGVVLEHLYDTMKQDTVIYGSNHIIQLG